MFYLYGLLPEKFPPLLSVHIWPAHIRNMCANLKHAVLVWAPFGSTRKILLILDLTYWLYIRCYLADSILCDYFFADKWTLSRPARKKRICPSFKRLSADFHGANLMDYTNNGLLKNNKNVNAAMINQVFKVPDEWHSENRFQDSYFNLG